MLSFDASDYEYTYLETTATFTPGPDVDFACKS